MTNKTYQVLLSRVESYDHARIKTVVEQARLEFGLQKNQFYGKRILLKPNFISSKAPAHAITDGRFIRGVAEWFIDQGAQVVIGDSPAFGSAEAVIRRHAIHEQIKHLAIEILEFKTPVMRTLSHGVSIGVAEESLCCDVFVNLPKIKAHNQMYVTMGVKNCFGIVCGMRKAMAHMKNGASHLRFADLMLDLTELLPYSLVIADGITGMHREGPVNGDRINLGCMAISNNPVALDTSLLDVLELDHERCPIWQAARKREMAASHRENISYPAQQPSEFYGSGFLAPASINPVPFNPFRFLTSIAKRLSLSTTV